MDWAALFACITALGTGWFAYNQLKHNRLADIKAKELERQLERKSTRRSENSARVYGEIHKVLNDLSCDRVYIIQPYPLGDNHYLTILYEVTAKGVARISDFWQDIKMSELPKFTASMARNELMLIRDIDSLDGTRAKAMFSSNGTQSLIVQKLHDTTHDLSLIHISEPTRLGMISYAVFCLKKKKRKRISFFKAMQEEI